MYTWMKSSKNYWSRWETRDPLPGQADKNSSKRTRVKRETLKVQNVSLFCCVIDILRLTIKLSDIELELHCRFTSATHHRDESSTDIPSKRTYCGESSSSSGILFPSPKWYLWLSMSFGLFEPNGCPPL